MLHRSTRAPHVRTPPFTLSFRALAMLLVAAATLPLVLFTMTVLRELARDEQIARERQLLELARLQSLVVERELAASVRALTALATSARLAAGNLDGFEAEARRILPTQPSWESAILMDTQGRQLVNTAVPRSQVRGGPVEPASVETLVRTRRPVVGAMARGPDSSLAFPVRVPVTIDGALAYVLTAVVRPQALADTVTQQLPRTDEWTRTILDATGTIVARTRTPERYVGTPGTAPFLAMVTRAPEGVELQESLEGELVYAAFSRGPSFGWYSAVVVPRAIVDGAVQGSVWSLSLFSVIAITLTLFGAWVFASRVARTLRDTAAAADTLARGGTPAPIRSVVTEIGALGGALDRSAALLAERADERDRHLQQAREAQAQAERAGRAKDEFLAMLGHELRNPLSPIVTALDLLRRRGADTGREHAIIARQVAHLTRLIDDLLDVSRITQGKVTLRRERTDLRAAAERAVEMTAPLFEERGHRLSVEMPPEPCDVVGDPARLSQVAVNLLANAARYTPAGGEVRLRVAREAGVVLLAVTDTGQGLAPELLPHVFDVFVQGARGAAREQGGLGLGLTIVRQLVQLHGGMVEAASAGPGQGSRFTVRIPAAAASRDADAGTPPAAPAATSPSPLKVLVVDDNHDAAELMQVLLELDGHTVGVAGDGPSALAAAATLRPDVVLLDLGLPGMDGYAVAGALHDARSGDAPAIVAVSGYGQAHDHARSAAAGFVAHLVKPVDHDALAALLARLAGDPPGRPHLAAPGLTAP